MLLQDCLSIGMLWMIDCSCSVQETKKSKIHTTNKSIQFNLGSVIFLSLPNLSRLFPDTSFRDGDTEVIWVFKSSGRGRLSCCNSRKVCLKRKVHHPRSSRSLNVASWRRSVSISSSWTDGLFGSGSPDARIDMTVAWRTPASGSFSVPGTRYLPV